MAERKRTRELGELLRHPDPPQLWFQLAEIVGKRTYLQHGVEVREGDAVLDVGANVGVAAAFFASECGAAVVHSFEPVPPLFELLRDNLKAFPACVAHGYGLSSTPGRAEILYYPRAAAMSGLHADPDLDREAVRTYLVNAGVPAPEAERLLEGVYDDPLTFPCELRTLSSVLREERVERVDLLKIDVEKAELDVLRGVEQEDWDRIRQVVVEVHDEDGRRATISEMLRGHGFSVTDEQEEMWRGTAVHMLYAIRA